MLPTFSSWLNRPEKGIPESDRIVPLIAQAGSRGMNRGQIGHLIKLEREVLDELLVGLVQFGLLTVSNDRGIQVFRAASLANQPLR